MGTGVSNAPRPSPDTKRISTLAIVECFEWPCPRIAQMAERIIAKASSDVESMFMAAPNSLAILSSIPGSDFLSPLKEYVAPPHVDEIHVYPIDKKHINFLLNGETPVWIQDLLSFGIGIERNPP